MGIIWKCDQLVEEFVTYTIHGKHNRRTSIGSAGFDPANPTNKRLQTYPLDCTATDTGYPIVSSTKSIIISHSSRSTQLTGFCANSHEVAGHTLVPDTGFLHRLLSAFSSISVNSGIMPWLYHERVLRNIFKFIFSGSLHNSSFHIVYNRDSVMKWNTKDPAKCRQRHYDNTRIDNFTTVKLLA